MQFLALMYEPFYAYLVLVCSAVSSSMKMCPQVWITILKRLVMFVTKTPFFFFFSCIFDREILMAEKFAHPNTALSYWQLTKLCNGSKCLNMSELVFHRKSVGNRKILIEVSKYSSAIFFCVKICQTNV